MACPYFFPVERVETDPWAHSPRMPLGAEFHGFCEADPANPREPDIVVQRTICNSGYGRGCCQDFPADAPADAVRFTPTSGGTGAEVRMVFVLERNHSPIQHGAFVLRAGRVQGEFPDARLERQAEVFASQCIRTKALA